MNHSIEAVDYEIKQSKIDGNFEVWTPDTTGGIIGIGKTREDAIKNAIATLGHTIASLVELIA